MPSNLHGWKNVSRVNLHTLHTVFYLYFTKDIYFTRVHRLRI